MGYITDISETANDSKFSATIVFLNDGNIKLGMSGSVTVKLQEENDVLAVPVESINIKDNKKYATVLNSDGTRQDKEVETGLSNANYVQILSGLDLNQVIEYEDISTGNTEVVATNVSSNTQGGVNNRQLMKIVQ